MFLDCLRRVLRARRIEPASRRQKGRDQELIEAQQDEGDGTHLGERFPHLRAQGLEGGLCRGGPGDEEEALRLPAEEGLVQQGGQAAADPVADHGDADALMNGNADHATLPRALRIGKEGEGFHGGSPAALAQTAEIRPATQADESPHHTVRR